MHIFKSVLAAAAIATAVSFMPQSPAHADGHLPNMLTGGEIVKTASFSGTNGHTVTGQVKIVKKGDIFYAVLSEDFLFDGAPDPRLGFSTNDNFIASTTFSMLNRDSGQQVYRLPASLDIANANFDELTIWCEQFSVELAEAKF